jgi:hypothetical protein
MGKRGDPQANGMIAGHFTVVLLRTFAEKVRPSCPARTKRDKNHYSQKCFLFDENRPFNISILTGQKTLNIQT